jgi:hypothetical protein
VIPSINSILVVTTTTTMTGATARMAASLKSGAVFRGWRMARVAYMPLAIPCLIPLEMRKRLRTALRHRSNITVMGIVPVIHVAVETVRPVVPRSRPKEYHSIHRGHSYTAHSQSTHRDTQAPRQC